MNDFDDLKDWEHLNPQQIKDNIANYSSEKLCEIIVCDRYLGCFNDLAVVCMEELGKRRQAGEDFNFEEQIENSFNELPKLEFTIPDLGSFLRQIIGHKNKA